MSKDVKAKEPPYKQLLPITVLISLLAILTTLVVALLPRPTVTPVPVVPPKIVREEKLATFNSCSEIVQAVQKIQKEQATIERDFFQAPGAPFALKAVPEGIGGAGGREYSTTNVQVWGVDEADIVKTDGTYIYSVSGGEVIISKAYPPNEAAVLSKIKIESGTPQEIFVQGNNILVLGRRTVNFPEGELYKEGRYYPYYGEYVFIEIWNTREKTSPELKRSLDFEGTYHTSRKIDNYAYIVLNSYRYYDIQNIPKFEEEILPSYRDLKGPTQETDFRPITKCNQVLQIFPPSGYGYLTVLSLPLDDYDRSIEKEVLFGASQNVYASLENLYIANTQYAYGILEKVLPQEIEKTTLYKFALDNGEITYVAQRRVPGHILNQFSMDEYEGYFRIATTVGQVSRLESKSASNVYILDENLKIVGAVEGLAPGEQIYSARFMGKRGYLVTFKKVDPFFTLDLSDPRNPRMAGKLKIPGYSDYLHPFDENHIIGLGKETEEALEGDFAWYQGIKIAIFDVSDFENPKELHKAVIGDRGTDSYALQDHKAFLFDRKKELLVIPVLLAEIPEARKLAEFEEANIYGEHTFQGAYVYRLTLKKGFELLGRITHYAKFAKTEDYYYYGDPYNIKRSLYIEDYLYTISEKTIGVNHLFDLKEVTKISF